MAWSTVAGSQTSIDSVYSCDKFFEDDLTSTPNVKHRSLGVLCRSSRFVRFRTFSQKQVVAYAREELFACFNYGRWQKGMKSRRVMVLSYSGVRLLDHYPSNVAPVRKLGCF
jgi:hypothetical protein